MPLYNNVLFPRKCEEKGTTNSNTNESATNVSKASSTTASASMRFLQDHLMSKKRSKHLTTSQQSARVKLVEVKSKNSENTLPIRRFCGEPCDWDPQDEYDPMDPNSYEILQADYLKAEEQRLLVAAMSKQCSSSNAGRIDTSLLDVLDELDSADVSDVRSNRGTTIAPPPTLQSASSISSTSPQEKSPRALERNKLGIDTASRASKLDGLSAAARIMSKMGYKSGQGLGKDEQGISTPLEVEMRSESLGRIIQKPVLTKQCEIKSEQSPVCGVVKAVSNQTRVLLLQNMVGPGEVDDDLEAETKEECTKYGEVVKCLIYEIPNKRVSDDQAVRIFVEFKTDEAALKASNDLNGRYFGGRIVKASFYDVDRFNRYELGP